MSESNRIGSRGRRVSASFRNLGRVVLLAMLASGAMAWSSSADAADKGTRQSPSSTKTKAVKRNAAKPNAAKRNAAKPNAAKPKSAKPAAVKPKAVVKESALVRRARLAVAKTSADRFSGAADAICDREEPGGYREHAELRMNDARVHTLDWQVVAGKRGQCRFALSDFEQGGDAARIELRSRTIPECRLMIWKRGDQVTLSQDQCHRFCGGEVTDRIWPALLDMRKKSCGS